MSAAPIATFENVSKSFDGKAAVVRNLDLALHAGEFLTLLGPSGSGKTTTLMMLAGFEEPTSGTIRLDGARINNVPAHKRGIGVVFQNYALFPHMSVAENLAFPLEMQGVGRADRDQKIRAALDMVRLEALADRRPSQLSGGQQQRVALARALIFQPRLVLMDEPLGALDKQLREHMQFEIRRLHRTLGLSVVYVTHDQGEALTMSDRIAVFHHGEVQQAGSPAQIYDEPVNAFVASFIGENNRLEGFVTRCEGSSCDVRLGNGAVLSGRCARPLDAGQRAALCIRPERVLIGPAAAPVNGCSGIVEELIYFGDHTRLVIRLDPATTLVARLTFRDALGGVAAGDRIPLSFGADVARVIPLGDAVCLRPV